MAEKYFSTLLNEGDSFSQQEFSWDQHQKLSNKHKQIDKFSLDSYDLLEDSYESAGDTDGQFYLSDEFQAQEVVKDIPVGKIKKKRGRPRLNKDKTSSQNIDLRANVKSGRRSYNRLEKYEVVKKLMAVLICQKEKFNINIVIDAMNAKNIGLQMDRWRFKDLYESLASDIINELEKCVQSQNGGCQPLDENKKTVLFKIITHCKSYLDQQSCKTIIDISKRIYQFGTYKIDRQSLIQLHQKLSNYASTLLKAKQNKRRRTEVVMLSPSQNRNQIVQEEVRKHKSRKSIKEINRCKNRVKAIWTQQHQNQLKSVYKDFRSMQKVKEHFCERFPNFKHLWTLQSLQSRLNIIIHNSIQLLSAYVFSQRTHNLPKLVHIDYNLNNAIKKSQSEEAGEVRVMLIELLQNKHEINSMRDMILRMNSFCEGLQQKMEHFSDGSVSDSKSPISVRSSNNKGHKNCEVKKIKQQ